jgi:hypothetical protein
VLWLWRFGHAVRRHSSPVTGVRTHEFVQIIKCTIGRAIDKKRNIRPTALHRFAWSFTTVHAERTANIRGDAGIAAATTTCAATVIPGCPAANSITDTAFWSVRYSLLGVCCIGHSVDSHP